MLAAFNRFDHHWFGSSSATPPVKRYEHLTGGELKKAAPTGIKLGKKAALSSGFQETSAALRARFGKIAASEREDGANAYSE